MDQTTAMLEDCPDHYNAQGLPRSLPCSRTAPTTNVLRNYPDHCSEIVLLGYM